ncbi:hypothetical protein EV702DRAFT_1149704 [Suillus placidus]|uniref:DUF6533 domain-containing protein n=1 Tax=Suillus placidus TaxID=48579 RepID=A0A9P6ZHL0_9AGAM|nr:hypothetical protein EV702DRAFT_1149704 [Suillus placidus]
MGVLHPDEFSSTVKLAFQTYDYACSLHEEWRFLLVSPWTKMKGLYIVTRYVPFLLLATTLYLGFIPNETPGKCRVLDNICSGFGMLSAVCSECFFILRTYVLWNNNRILLAAMLCISQIFIIASFGIVFATTVPAAYTPLGLLILTLIRAIQIWRTNPSRLYVVLLKHNIFYYAYGLLFSGGNIFTSLLLYYAYHAILQDFQVMILAILATRMHRHLWKMKPQTHGSDVLIQIPMSGMSPAEYTV